METKIQYCEDCAECTADVERCKARVKPNFVARDSKPEYMWCSIVRGGEAVCPNGFKAK